MDAAPGFIRVVGKKQDALAYRSGAGTLGNINTPSNAARDIKTVLP